MKKNGLWFVVLTAVAVLGACATATPMTEEQIEQARLAGLFQQADGYLGDLRDTVWVSYIEIFPEPPSLPFSMNFEFIVSFGDGTVSVQTLRTDNNPDNQRTQGLLQLMNQWDHLFGGSGIRWEFVVSGNNLIYSLVGPEGHRAYTEAGYVSGDTLTAPVPGWDVTVEGWHSANVANASPFVRR